MASIDTIPGPIRHWWAYEFLGGLFFLLSLMLLLNPTTGYAALVIYFGILFLFTGAVRISNAVSTKLFMNHIGWYALAGFVDMIVGLWIIFNPEFAAAVFPFFLGLLLFVGGSSLLFFSSDVKRLNLGKTNWITVIGIVDMILGILILFRPVYGAGLTLAWTGVGFFSLGIFYVYLGMSLRKLEHLDRA